MNCVTMAFEKKRRNFAKNKQKTWQKNQTFAKKTAENKTLQKNKTL